MGSEQSTEQVEGREDWPQAGYHVLNVSPGCPGDGLLIPFFDFIVKANEVYFEVEDSALQDVLSSNVNVAIPVVVWNSRTEQYRTIQLTPSNSWGGDGLLGVSIRFCTTEVVDHVWHILEVAPGGPAALCGLQAATDWILGTPDIMLNSREDFFTVVSMNVDKQLALYVFSSVTDSVRTVRLTPSRAWGGEGLLGCDVGYGCLHGIPSKSTADPGKAKLEAQKDAMRQLQMRANNKETPAVSPVAEQSPPATPTPAPVVAAPAVTAPVAVVSPVVAVDAPIAAEVTPTKPAPATHAVTVAPEAAHSLSPEQQTPETPVKLAEAAERVSSDAPETPGASPAASTATAPSTQDRRKKLADLQSKLKKLKEREKEREKDKSKAE